MLRVRSAARMYPIIGDDCSKIEITGLDGPRGSGFFGWYSYCFRGSTVLTHSWSPTREVRAPRPTAWRAFSLTLFVLGAATVLSCARRDVAAGRAMPGAVSLGLKLSATTEFKTFTYALTGNGLPPVTGELSIDDATGPRVSIIGLPPGPDFSLALSAVSTDGKTTCSGMASVTVVAGETALANVLLECRMAAGGVGAGGAGGGAPAGGDFDHCPVLRSYVAAPMSAAVGASMKLSATAVDADGDPITVTFTGLSSATVGTLVTAPPVAGSSPTATFTCAAPGSATITIAASDGRCKATGTVVLTCAGTTGAGGTAGSGGAVGSGGVAGSGGAPGSGGVVGSGGVLGSGGAGTGGVVASGGSVGTGGEAPGTGGAGTGGVVASGGSVGTGGAAPGTGGAGTGGAGTGGTAGGNGSGGGGGAGGAPMCLGPAECVSDACSQCTSDNCISDTDGCQIFPTGSQDHALCEAAYACFTDPVNNCTIQGDPLKCWCGTNPTTCLTDNSPPTQANGVCLQQVFAAAKSMDAPTIRLRLGDNGFPLGGAVNLTVCRGGFCSTECGVK